MFLEEWINPNPAVTLKEMQINLESVASLRVCLSTVGNTVNGMLYSTKKLHHKPSTMNSPANKAKHLGLSAYIDLRLLEMPNVQ